MTVIVGIKCADGIVLGADGAATLGSLGLVTAQQRTLKKITARGAIAIAVAGHVGLGQRIRAVLEEGLSGNQFTGRTELMTQQMRRMLWQQVVQIEMDAARITRETLQSSGATDAACSQTLLAAPLNGRPELVHFDEQCAPTIVTDELPFAAIGAGQQIADPFLAFVRRVLWPSGVPTLATATFSALWTLQHVIDANSVGIGGPVQLITLTQHEGEWVAREVDASALTEHEASVRDAEDTVRAWGARFATPGASRIAAPPT